MRRLPLALLCAALAVGFALLSRRPPSRVAIVLDGPYLAEVAQALGFEPRLSSGERVRLEVCRRLLGLDTPLPVAVLLEGGRVRGVVIGYPSKALWPRIASALEEGPILAYSVPEELAPWRCAACPPSGRNIEGIARLSEGEVEELERLLEVRR